MMTDPISDLLAQIKNGYMAHKDSVSVPYSKFKAEILNLLSKEGFVGKIEVEVQTEDKVNKGILCELLYKKKQPQIKDIVRVSKISRRIYVQRNAIPKVLGGIGISVISTPSGLMTDREARKKKIGGEIIFKVW